MSDEVEVTMASPDAMGPGSDPIVTVDVGDAVLTFAFTMEGLIIDEIDEAGEVTWTMGRTYEEIRESLGITDLTVQKFGRALIEHRGVETGKTLGMKGGPIR